MLKDKDFLYETIEWFVLSHRPLIEQWAFRAVKARVLDGVQLNLFEENNPLGRGDFHISTVS